MNKVKIQFDNDKPIEMSEIEDNKDFTISLVKTNVNVGGCMEAKQESTIFNFTDGNKTFKIYIE